MASQDAIDTFETGAVSGTWSVGEIDVGGDGSVVSTTSYEGTYCYKIVLDDAVVTTISDGWGARDTMYVGMFVWMNPSDWDSGSDCRLIQGTGGLVMLDCLEDSGVVKCRFNPVFGVTTAYDKTFVAAGWYHIKVMATRNGAYYLKVVPPNAKFGDERTVFSGADAGAGVSQLFGVAVGDCVAAGTKVNSTIYYDNIEVWDGDPGTGASFQSEIQRARTMNYRSVVGPGNVGGL